MLHNKLKGMTASVHAKLLRTPSQLWGAYHVSVDAVWVLATIPCRLPDTAQRDCDDATDEE